MPLFRKKPVTIEAVQYEKDGNLAWHQAPRWLWEALESGVAFNRDGRLMLRTLEGEHVVSDGDWIIRGVKGELYPCKPDIFALTYEPADSRTTPAGRADAASGAGGEAAGHASNSASAELEAILGSRSRHDCAGWDCANCHERDNAIRDLLADAAPSLDVSREDVQWLRDFVDAHGTSHVPDGVAGEDAQRIREIAARLAVSFGDAASGAPETLPTGLPHDLRVRLEAADVTTRHLRDLYESKHTARAEGKPAPFGGSMVEAIIVWWESGVRDEVLSGERARADAAPPQREGR
jgi:hypothetical protein